MTRIATHWRALRDGGLWPQLLATGVRLIDLPSRYAFHLIVAAKLGVAAAGGFYLAFSAMMLAAGFGRAGIDRAVTRAVARAMERGDPGAARAAIARGFAIVVPLSIAVAAAVLALAQPVAALILDRPELARALMLGAATIPPLAVAVVAGGALAGLHRLGWSLMVYSWLWPALFCAVALFVPLDIERALILIAAATALSAVAGLALLWRFAPPKSAAKAPVEPLVSTGLSLFSSEIVQLLLGYAPILVLGVVASDRDVGLYALAWRLALVINLLTTTVAAIAAPRFAALHVRGDDMALRRAAGQAIALATVLALVPLGAMLAFPREILGVVGPGFETAATTLRLLLVGQAVAVLCTGSAELLGMTDHSATLRRINLATLGLLLALLAALGAAWGSAGAAVATSVTIAVSGIAMALAIRRHLGFVPLLATVARGDRAAVPA